MINLEIANHLTPTYNRGVPYPHIVLDNFIPTDIANQCYLNMSNYNNWGYDDMLGYSEFERDSQVNKFFTPWSDDTMNSLQSDMPVVWKVIQYLNSPMFLSYLENLTGINNIVADPTLNGGGCHYIKRGGKLSLHTDYGKHSENGLYRRLNLLLYLTPDWKEEWGGHLEMWRKEPRTLLKKILPSFNRAIIFNTTNKSIHGHPHPLDIPEDVGRYSIAMYYFTKDVPPNEQSDDVSAVWY